MAELALATVPVAAKALSLCLDLYTLFTETKHMGDVSQVLLWKFRIQHVRLQIWGEEWGLLRSSAHRSTGDQDHDVDHLVLETLMRISVTLKDYKDLKSRYDLSLASDTVDKPALVRQNTVEDLINEELPRFATRDSELRASRSKSTGILAKLRWAVSDKPRLVAIIKDLKDYNDGLYHFLSATERRRLRRGLGHELVRQSSPDELGDLQQAAEGYELLPDICALRQKYIDTVSSPISMQINQIPATSVRAADEELVLSLADLTISTTRATTSSVICRERTVYHGKQSEAPVHALVEWKNYSQNDDERVQDEMVAKLASLLRFSTIAKPLCIPRCIGYISDHLNFRTGLVFRYETNVPPMGQELRSFDDLLGVQGVPPLGDRFQLAFNLASSLSILHTAGWVHKFLSAANVLFFDPITPNANDFRVGKPFLLGFGYSRPNEAGAVSEFISAGGVDYHRHPAAQGLQRSRYCPAFDIYSLGVLLLEIGYWRRIREFWKPEYNPATFRRHLTKFHAPRLAPKTGLIYSNLVATCLGGELSEAGLDDKESQRQFYWLVVNELSRLVV